MFLKKKIIDVSVFILSVAIVSLGLSYIQIHHQTTKNLGNILVRAAGAFLGLSDTPSSYLGQAGKIIAVNQSENAVEFVFPPKLIISNFWQPAGATTSCNKICSDHSYAHCLSWVAGQYQYSCAYPNPNRTWNISGHCRCFEIR